MDLDAKQFTTSALANVTGCEPMTFRTWRNRNGLFPEVAGGRTWKRFSVLDLCIVRAIVVMTRQGVGATDAIWCAEKHLGDVLASLLQGNDDERYVAFAQGSEYASGDSVLSVEGEKAEIVDGSKLKPARIIFKIIYSGDTTTVTEMMRDAQGILTVIDLLQIVQHVLAGLGITAETIAAGKDD